MGGGNGAKAQQKRERNAKNAAKTNTSNLGTNNERIRCNRCFRFWMESQELSKGGAKEHYDDNHTKDGPYEKIMSRVPYNGK